MAQEDLVSAYVVDRAKIGLIVEAALRIGGAPPYGPFSLVFRRLSVEEAEEFRVWARKEWALWHPVVREEIKAIVREERDRE